MKIKKKKFVITKKGSVTIESDIEPKSSDIDTVNTDNTGKVKRKLGGIPVKTGKCVFPFKNEDKYISEDDGCIEGKTGDWCATNVDKDDDYKVKTFAYCKK